MSFTGIGGESDSPAAYQLFFVDQRQHRASENARVEIAPGQTVSCHFLLDARMSSETLCYLAIQEADGADDALQQLLPFVIRMTFTTDFGF